MKLEKEIARLANTKSRRGWNIVVPDAGEYSRLIDAIVEEGFSLRYQGASIDSFILEDLGEALESFLLKSLVPSGSTVVLQFAGKTPNDDDEKPGAVEFNVYVENSKTPLKFTFKRPHVDKPLTQNTEEQIITAFHEAGHSIMRQVVMSDRTKPGMISIIPGVTQIDNQWVLYEGIATSEVTASAHLDRDFFVKSIAIYAAGEIAERMVTVGESHTAGKADDMARATALAQDAILRFGLSPAWGTHAIPAGMTKVQYLATLSDAQKQLLETETKKLIEEGRRLARHYLELNFKNALIPLGLLLAEKGIVPASEMQAFYERVPLDRSPLPAGAAAHVAEAAPEPGAKTGTLRSDIPRPKQVADIQAIVEKRKREQFNEVPPPEHLPVGSNAAFEAAKAGPSGGGGATTCTSSLKKRAS
jgi:hypothetical protein